MENILSPWRALNKAFLRLNPSWQEITPWRDNLLNLLQNIHEGETEEFHKNLIRDFLQKTYYQNNHFINTKGLCDLVVHMGKDTNSPVGLILEFKSPTNKAEMPKPDQLNVKGLQQLLFYFLAERINQKNFELKHLIVTNCYEWFVFDAQEFERLFIQNQALVKQFKDFDTDQLSGSSTKFFYENIAGPAIENILPELNFTYWNLRNHQAVIEKATPDQELTAQEQQNLVALFKIFSPEHLLKLPFANDSNTLNREFYNELLHIIGLTETKHGNKKLIERLPANERNPGSLLEGAIAEIENLDKLSRLSNPERYGNTAEEQLFNVALELVITWVNRILFLKLLEAQLIRYHQGDRSYGFLNISKLEDFSDLNKLFFSILARQIEGRPAQIKDKFNHVPYLNSSLFEPTDLEMNIIAISNLGYKSSVFHNTVLRDSQGNRLTGKLDAIQYLFEFLDAYDFGSDGAGGIQEKSKSLINAAVLGLIFEKINGYQDGSFYTPGFITMYMCRETIRRAVVQKFNEVKGWNCHNFDDLQDDVTQYIKKSSERMIARNEANQIINSLKICDPAVGSGHFLVSALNEIIVVKHQLGILQDKNSKTLGQYEINVENDELIITDTNNDNVLFEYNPKNKESQRVQETIFHEKQTLIENCLFGVDININSVKICQLRLWIELLKNAYYKEDQQLETLPNIDINIKHGNSLISRFPLDGDLGPALRKNNLDVVTYRNAVQTYRNAMNKAQKQEMVKLMETIKGNFKTTLFFTDPRKVKLSQLEGEVFNLENQTFLFEESKTDKKARERKIAKLNSEIDKLKVAIEEEESGRLYANALEWRFEFPEVLSDQGDFIGFDIVIGNPPYVFARENFNDTLKQYFADKYKTSQYQINLFLLFIEITTLITKRQGEFTVIIPNSMLMISSSKKVRQYLLNQTSLIQIVNLIGYSFEGVNVETIIISAKKEKPSKDTKINILLNKNVEFELSHCKKQFDFMQNEGYELNVFSDERSDILTQKLIENSELLNDLVLIKAGLMAYESGKGNPKQSPEDVKNRIYDYTYKFDNDTHKYLEGKDVGRYFIKWSGAYLKYGQNLAAPRNFNLFDSKKIIIREITGKLPYSILANYTEEIYLFNRSNIVILEREDVDISLKYVLAVLNSKLISYYFMKNTAKSVRQMFPKLILEDLRKFPFKKIMIKEQKVFISIVDKILKAKKSNPDADTTKLETEIDRLVYELYGLTEEEIAIVENHND
jgi:hypothetical protein